MRARSGAGLLVLLLLVAPLAAGTPLAPSPELAPGTVVRAQLEALRSNGPGDRGIATCFRFASPGNRQATGPLERFARMIKQGPYALMLSYRSAEYGPVTVNDGIARQRVVLTGATTAVTFVFVLSRQSHAACRGCWMTDAVLIEGIEQRVARRGSTGYFETEERA